MSFSDRNVPSVVYRGDGMGHGRGTIDGWEIPFLRTIRIISTAADHDEIEITLLAITDFRTGPDIWPEPEQIAAQQRELDGQRFAEELAAARGIRQQLDRALSPQEPEPQPAPEWAAEDAIRECDRRMARERARKETQP